jgi:hypothetical protein
MANNRHAYNRDVQPRRAKHHAKRVRRCRSANSGRLMTLLDLSLADFRRFLTVLVDRRLLGSQCCLSTGLAANDIISEAQRWQIIGMHTTGMSFKAIGRQMGYHYTVVSRLVRKPQIRSVNILKFEQCVTDMVHVND